jgi:hypothetical protein
VVVEHVVSILESLANGVDPTTDTEIPHPLFASPEVIRALFTAANMLQQEPVTVAPVQRRRAPAAGKRWNDEEDAQVCREYDQGLSFTEMGSKHARTTGAIMGRLIQLGRIDPNTLAPRPAVSPLLTQ